MLSIHVFPQQLCKYACFFLAQLNLYGSPDCRLHNMKENPFWLQHRGIVFLLADDNVFGWRRSYATDSTFTFTPTDSFVIWLSQLQ